jgi:hypothetical protein
MAHRDATIRSLAVVDEEHFDHAGVTRPEPWASRVDAGTGRKAAISEGERPHQLRSPFLAAKVEVSENYGHRSAPIVPCRGIASTH